MADLWETTDASGFTLVSVVAIVWASSLFFVAWRDMLEMVWDIEQENGLKHSVRDRILAMLVPIVFGLLVAAVLILEVVAGFLVALIDWSLFDATVQLASSLVPALASTAAVALLFRYSAREACPSWRSVLPASILSVIGLGIASWCFGIYVQYIGSESVAGAATSIFVGLVFMYYAAQIMLFGAELIKVLEQRAQA
jgi:membrane protein